MDRPNPAGGPVKVEPGTGAAGGGRMPDTDIDIDLQDVKKECLEYCKGIEQTDGSINMEAVTINAEPGTREEDRERIPLVEIEKDLLDVKMEYLERITQAAVLLTDLKVRPGEIRFVCSHCDYFCLSKCALERHFGSHTGGKSFSRFDCLDSSSKRANLTNLLLIHGEEKPYSCSDCNYTCSRKGNLRRHMLTHSGETPFSCFDCNYSSSRKGHWRRHMLTHSEEKLFSCSDCNYLSSRKGNLTRHMLTHSGENLFHVPTAIIRFY